VESAVAKFSSGFWVDEQYLMMTLTALTSPVYSIDSLDVQDPFKI